MRHGFLALIVLMLFVRHAAADTLIITKANGKTVTFNVEIANTPEAEIHGLMFRKSLPKNAGMLFLFDQADRRAFWMRNTLIPLDMLFMKPNGTILNIHANAKPLDETPIYSTGPSNAVLEINGGRAAALGIKPGDVVHHTFFGNSLAETPAIH